jgi:hypothetical protein
LNGSFDQNGYPEFYAYISVDNATGTDLGYDLPIDFTIYLNAGSYYPPEIDLQVEGNSTLNLEDTVSKGLSYYKLTDNNHTIEFGYKLQTYYNDSGINKGYLNVSLGQTIYLRMKGQQDSDNAPDMGLPSIRYTVKTPSGNIPGFNLLFPPLALLTVFALNLLARKKE